MMNIKSIRHARHALVLIGLALASPAMAGLTISTTNNIAGGIAGFGTATPLITWSNYSGGSFVDPGTGATASGSLLVTNWINGPGFDRNGGPAPDLAINGP
jgi:phosphate/sulfate permease